MITAYVPRIGGLLQGLAYDMAVAEAALHRSEVTEHPLEDPENSSLVDHIREEPIELNLTITVSTNVLGAAITSVTVGDATPATSDELLNQRIGKLQDALLEMKQLHTVSTREFITVQTGVREYNNLAITELSFEREPETPNTMEISISLREVRLAATPQTVTKGYPMEANHGNRSRANGEELVLAQDRFITEKHYNNPRSYGLRTIPVTDERASIIRGALRALPVSLRASITATSEGIGVTANLQIHPLEDFPSYAAWHDDTSEMNFSYNSLADQWSITVGDVNGNVVVGGRFMTPGYNIMPTGTRKFIPLHRQGFAGNKYDGYTRPQRDGLPPFFLVSGEQKDFAALGSVI